MSGETEKNISVLFCAAWRTLIDRRRWVLWRYETPSQGGKPTKRAYDLRGQRTSTKNDFAFWGSLRDTLTFANRYPRDSWNGVGYVPDGTEGLVFIDIDDCRDALTGALSQGASDLIQACNSYTEITPSGAGLRIIGTSSWPLGGWGKRVWTLPDGTRGEMYHHVNFVTVSFNRLSGTPDIFDPIDSVVSGLLPAAITDTDTDEEFTSERDPHAPLDIIEETLSYLPNPSNNWEFFNNVGMACFRACGGDYAGLELWRGWSSKCDTHSDAECDARWANYEISPPDALGFGSLIYWAREAPENKAVGWEGGYLWLKTHRGPESVGECPFSPLPIEDMSGVSTTSTPDISAVDSRVAVPQFSDEDLARRYVDKYLGDARHVQAWSQWFIWKDTHWQRDNINETYSRAREICSDAANIKAQQSTSLKGLQAAAALASASTVAHVEKLARYDMRIATAADAWDTDPWIINTPAGTLDLRTGVLRSCDQADMITRITPASLDTDICDLWLSFLNDVTQGDQDLVAYLRRVAGYCLTGCTKEHALFYLHGSGGNGKSSYLNALLDVLGVDNYGQTAPMDLLLSTGHSDHPTEIARLRGARLVVASETEEGRRWNEQRITSLTGGDPMTARFMREDYFTFLPQCKFLIAGNHKPHVRSVNEAITRRLSLIPFDAKIAKDKLDKSLADKLRANRNKIFGWMLQGCLEWQRVGLQPPAKVRHATAEYMENENTRAIWWREKTVIAPGHQTPVANLFAAWRAYAELANESPGTRKDLTDWLRANNIQLSMDSAHRAICLGFRLVDIVASSSTGPTVTVAEAETAFAAAALPATKPTLQ